MSRVLVQQDRDAIDGATALEVILNLFRRRAVVDVAYEDTSRINVLSPFAGTLRAALVMWVVGLIILILHLRKALRLLFDGSKTLLHLLKVL